MKAFVRFVIKLCILRNKHTVNTMRPRSGKEYHNFDRSTIILVQQAGSHCKSASPVSSISSSTANYVNITPVPESSESPSPGYQSSSSFQEEIPLMNVRKLFQWKCVRLSDFYFTGNIKHLVPVSIRKEASLGRIPYAISDQSLRLS